MSLFETTLKYFTDYYDLNEEGLNLQTLLSKLEGPMRTMLGEPRKNDPDDNDGIMTFDDKDVPKLKSILQKMGNRRVAFTNSDNIVKKHYSQMVYHKPDGLWYALGNEWFNMITDDDEGGTLEHMYRRYKSAFYLDIDYSNILRLNTMEKMIKFSEIYVYNLPKDTYNVDWNKVAKQYKGIEIIPYQYRARRNERTEWYESWDVASGCIWDTSAIKKSIKIYSRTA